MARETGRDAIGIEINPEYVKMAEQNLRLNEQLVNHDL
jgi:DNA modification methylase